MRLIPALTACALALAVAAPASAEVSIGGGVYTSTSPSTTGGAVLLSTGASIPQVPVDIQATIFVPLVKGGGYALTGEVRGFTGGGFGGAYVGGGIGVGNLSSDRRTGPVFTIFGGKSVAPFTSVEARLIKSTQTNGATAGFLGLRFSF
jgi:hypothetical protein